MSSLDDFFAKKDRKKSATKTNLLAADVLYRTLEETTKATQEVDSTENMQLKVLNNSHAPLEFGICFSNEAIGEEDEWCDFTEEGDQPFSNLKRNSKLILCSSALISTEDMRMASDHCHYQDTVGDGLGVGLYDEDLGKPHCPWLKLQRMQLPNLDPSVDESFEQKAQSTNISQLNTASKKQVYVPPALRQSQSEFSVWPKKQPCPVPAKTAKGQAPDLNNDEFFPSLCQSRISKRAK